MNSVALIGNLATEVDLRELSGDKRVATFLLAVDRPTNDDTADFFRISVWDRQAETCSQYLAKGRKVGVEGRLRSDTYDDRDGIRRTSVEVSAHRVEFLSPPPAEGEVVPFERAVAAG